MLIKKLSTIAGISLLAFTLGACTDSNEKEDPIITPNEEQEDRPVIQDNANSSDSMDDEPNLDQDNHAETIKPNDDPTITAIVNKEYSLDETYAPDDLVFVTVPTVFDNPDANQLRKEAADALEEMFDEAKKSGHYLYARSGYRSYQIQDSLFQSNVEKNGLEEANRYSAKPGESEHQTGLVMDVTSENVNFELVEAFGETDEGIWLQDNAHHFGFIIRYPKDKEEITGYIYEPWHLRYLGTEMATFVYESGLSYEEFLELEGVLQDFLP